MKKVVVAAVCLIMLVAASLSASASGTLPEAFLTVKAESGGSTAIYSVDTQSLLSLAADNTVVDNGELLWSLPAGTAIDMVAGGATLGRITQLQLGLGASQAVTLRFSLESNDSNAVWTVLSTLNSFAAIPGPTAYASAAITVTSDENGATLTGQFAGDKAYQARYNNTSVFANLVDPVVAPGNESVTGRERAPVSGWSSIAGNVTAIQSEFQFKLTSGNLASGTSRFEVVPEPSSLLALGFGLASVGGLLLKKRRA